MFIVVLKFRAFDRYLEQHFIDRELLMRYSYKRRIKKICPTAVIHSVTWYRAEKINEETIKPQTT